MNRSWGALRLAGAPRRGFQLALMASLLAGCGMFGSDNTSPPAPTQAAGNQPYPNLGTVPMQVPVPTPAAERQAIQAGLVADQQSADNSLSQPAQGTPPPPAQAMTQVPLQQTAGLSAETLPMPAPQAPTVAGPTMPFYANPSAPLPKIGGREQLYPAPYAPFLGGAASPAYGGAYAASNGGLPAAGQPLAVILFAEGSTSLSERDMAALGNVAQVQRQQGGRLRVIGHASDRATTAGADRDAVDQQISMARAQAVAGALIRLGAAQGSISLAGVGSQLPVASEATAAGEAANRRVEVFLVP